MRRDASTPSVPTLPADLAILTPLRLSSELLLKIAAKARKQGVAAHEVLLAEEIMTPEDYYRCLGQKLDLPISGDLDQCDAISSALLLAPQGRALLGLLEGRTPIVHGAAITTPQRRVRRYLKR